MNPKKRRERPSKTWPTILKDVCDSDWSAIVEVLRYQLERTRKRIVGNDIVMDAKKIGRDIKKAEDLLQRLLDDPYHDEAFAGFNKKHGKAKLVIVEPTPEEARENPKRGSKIEFLHRGKPATEAMMDERRELYKLEQKLQQDDLNEALRIIGEGLLGWLD